MGRTVEYWPKVMTGETKRSEFGTEKIKGPRSPRSRSQAREVCE